MLWTVFAFISGVFLLVFLYFSRTRQSNEPPLDKGFLPWLGHALEFGKDASKFLARMKDKHGDIFTVRVAGLYLTFLLDPQCFDAVLKDTDAFEVGKSRTNLLEQIFHLNLNSIENSDKRNWMQQHFHSESLGQLCTKIKSHMQHLLLTDFNHDNKWRHDGLFSLCYSLLFRAGYLTLFESEGNAAAVYEEFRKFDDRLTRAARKSLTQGERKLFIAARENLWELLSPTRIQPQSKSWQQDYIRFLQREGVDTEMQKRASLLQLWTTQCNAGPAAFWLLGFLLTHPEAMREVQSELRGLTSKDMLSLGAHPTPVLDSVLSETLRLRAAVMISRDVVQNKTLHMSVGREYLLRKGDKICLFPFLSPQTNPDIHPEPQMFKYDRFLNVDMTKKTTFVKDGMKLKHYTMPWGAGRNMCVGKEFAVFTIKQFVFLFLTHVDVELRVTGARLPPVDPSRYGFGILQPAGDLQVRYRLKTTKCNNGAE